jgi:putative phosphoesterase
MIRIGLISDTHGWLDEQVFRHFEACDEIWHAGDFGSMDLIDQLAGFKPLRGVYGNIDEPAIRHRFPERLSFDCEGLRICMQHIGGYPGRYAPGVKQWLQQQKAGLFISGHSHILKVQFDPSLQCLHLNPGAAGRQGWHVMRTLLRFSVAEGRVENLEVIELGKRGT